MKVDDSLCKGCKQCVSVCPNSAISINQKTKTAQIDQSLCALCGICIEECPTGALRFITETDGSNFSKPVYENPVNKTPFPLCNNSYGLGRGIRGCGKCWRSGKRMNVKQGLVRGKCSGGKNGKNNY
ncbi:MAG TPA: 4Fe-4S binding protein [Spirochaetota bacterium]|nr:4Fe-4S binding protein [Spirochaetota bacterium]